MGVSNGGYRIGTALPCLGELLVLQLTMGDHRRMRCVGIALRAPLRNIVCTGSALCTAVLLIACSGKQTNPTAGAVSIPIENPPAGDPSDARAQSRKREEKPATFASFVLQAARAVQLAAWGQPHDAGWNGPDSSTDLRGTDPEVVKKVKTFGEGTIRAVGLRVEGGAEQDHRPSRFFSIVFVFPDERVRWGTMEVRHGDSASSTVELATLRSAAPLLADHFEKTTRSLHGACDLQSVELEDLKVLPPQWAIVMASEGVNVKGACQFFQKPYIDGPLDWRPEYGPLIVFVDTPTAWVGLKADISIKDGSVFFGPAQFMDSLPKGSSTTVGNERRWASATGATK
jgi:hypothetical protein